MEKRQLLDAPFDSFDVLNIFSGRFPDVARFVTLLHESIIAA